MSDATILVPTKDGEADSVFLTPDGKGPWPGVVYLTDVWGIRPDVTAKSLLARLEHADVKAKG